MEEAKDKDSFEKNKRILFYREYVEDCEARDTKSKLQPR